MARCRRARGKGMRKGETGRKLARTAGLEPTTSAFGGLHSIQMSYVRESAQGYSESEAEVNGERADRCRSAALRALRLLVRRAMKSGRKVAPCVRCVRPPSVPSLPGILNRRFREVAFRRFQAHPQGACTPAGCGAATASCDVLVQGIYGFLKHDRGVTCLSAALRADPGKP